MLYGKTISLIWKMSIQIFSSQELQLFFLHFSFSAKGELVYCYHGNHLLHLINWESEFMKKKYHNGNNVNINQGWSRQCCHIPNKKAILIKVIPVRLGATWGAG